MQTAREFFSVAVFFVVINITLLANTAAFRVNILVSYVKYLDILIKKVVLLLVQHVLAGTYNL